MVVFGVCVFFSSVVTDAGKWRFVSSSFCSCEKRSVPTYIIHRDAFYGKWTVIGNFATKWTLHWPGLLSPAQVDVHILPSVVFLLRQQVLSGREFRMKWSCCVVLMFILIMWQAEPPLPVLEFCSAWSTRSQAFPAFRAVTWCPSCLAAGSVVKTIGVNID